jgi:hypothetical protein
MHNTLEGYLSAAYPMTEAQATACRAAKTNLFYGPDAAAAEGLPGWTTSLDTLRDYVDNLPGDVYEDRDCGQFTDVEPHQMMLDAGDWHHHEGSAIVAAALGCKDLATYF